ncbi:MAG TPA: tetratricopeptide repeat protein [Candidatus Binatia bacterium]
MAKSTAREIKPDRRETPTAPAAWWLRWSLPLVVAALALLVFLPALKNGFVDWDDYKTLLENPDYRGLDWPRLRWMFTTFYMGHYQPLSWMTLGLDYLLWGMDPFGYHLTNLVLHAANAAVFYFVALRLLSLALPAAGPDGDTGLRLGAGFAALVFAVHPLRVESVAWVTERRDVLSGLFFLLTIVCYLKGAAAKADGARRRWIASAVVLYALSLLSKAAGMALPVVLIVLDVYPLRRLGAGGKWLGPEARRVWLEKMPFFLLAVAFGGVALLAQRETGALLSLEQYPILRRAGQALFGVAFYLWKTAAPLELSPIYEIPIRLESADWFFFGASVVVDLAITALLIVQRRRWPALLAAWICYLALLAPVLGFAQSGSQLAADRYTYLACLAWAIVAGGALFRLWQSRFERAREIVGGGAALAVIIVLGLGTLAWLETGVWRDPLTLWRHAVRVSPRASKAHNSLAIALYYRGAVLEAIEHYRTALRIDPRYKEAHNNLGVALVKRGDAEGAVAEYRAALEIDPAYVDARYNLGNALSYRGEIDQSIEQFREVVRIDPGHEAAKYNLQVLLELQKKK